MKLYPKFIFGNCKFGFIGTEVVGTVCSSSAAARRKLDLRRNKGSVNIQLLLFEELGLRTFELRLSEVRSAHPALGMVSFYTRTASEEN